MTSLAPSRPTQPAAGRPPWSALATSLAMWTLSMASAAVAAATDASAPPAGASATRLAPQASAPNAALNAPPLRAAGSPAEPGVLRPCRLKGVENGAQCGFIRRALDPAQPAGTQIEVHYAVLPAMARRKAADPVFFFAGGPGQSAIDLAGVLSKRYARFSHRRDLVFVDQRGTGRSAPLKCADDSDRPPLEPLAHATDEARRLQRIQECLSALKALPHGDLRQYTTPIAMGDVDAVRAALGAEQINAIGGSYGTRAVLEYQRQFPQRVRRAVIDGVAPPDMVLPASFSPDNQAALQAMFAACEAEPGCRARHPDLQRRWQALLSGLPARATLAHPMTGREETLTLTRDMLVSLVRGPLYVPTLASGLPAAIDEAARGRFGPLLGLSTAMAGGGAGGLATGMHFSVVCTEDLPRLAGSNEAPGADFGRTFEQMYVKVCADWPRGTVPAAFYQVPPARQPVLVLSGGIDPVTPPRHGERVTRLLGAKARHVVVAQAGHGVLAVGCMRDAVVRFVGADTDDEALKIDLGCADKLPRPGAFRPVGSQTDSQADRVVGGTAQGHAAAAAASGAASGAARQPGLEGTK